MKITLTDDQVNSLFESEINKRVSEQVGFYNKELSKLKAQLNDALEVVNGLLTNEAAFNQKVQKKTKLTDELFIKRWNEGMRLSDIAKETGYASSYLSVRKKKLVLEGKIAERAS